MNRRGFLTGCAGLTLGGLLAAALPRRARADDERPPLGDPEALREWWERQTPERREQLRSRYERYQNLPRGQREQLGLRMERWKQLSPERRGRIRRRWERFRSLPPERQQRIRKNMRRWQELDAGKRGELRRRFERYEKLSPEQKKRARQRARSQRERGNRTHPGPRRER